MSDGVGRGAVVVAPEVAAALASGRAVVALESTIVSHGMPFPQNLTMAREVEAVVRQHGAVPATIAIMDGVPRVGLSDEHLERLAKMGGDAAKVSRRDVASVVARGATGATTVSATMLLAERAGIAVFVTGEVRLNKAHGHGRASSRLVCMTDTKDMCRMTLNGASPIWRDLFLYTTDRPHKRSTLQVLSTPLHSGGGLYDMSDRLWFTASIYFYFYN